MIETPHQSQRSAPHLVIRRTVQAPVDTLVTRGEEEVAGTRHNQYVELLEQRAFGHHHSLVAPKRRRC